MYRWRVVIPCILAPWLGLAAATSWAAPVSITQNERWPEAHYQLDSLSVENGATLRIAGGSLVDVSGQIRVIGNSTILLEGKNTTTTIEDQWQGAGVSIQAADMLIESGSRISADSQGYLGNGNGAGLGPGGGAALGGGGHGGHGGVGVYGGGAYGSPLEPITPGSGGGGTPYYGGTGGAGGGALRLIVSGTLQLDGAISANGGGGTRAEKGGGAGGSIWITTAILSGSGAMSANGGNFGNGDDFAGGGGGGRVAVYYQNAEGYTAYPGCSVRGGTGKWTWDGAPGTMTFVDVDQDPQNLQVPFSRILPEDTTAQFETIAIAPGATLVVGGGSTLNVGRLDLPGTGTLVCAGKNTEQMVDEQWVGVGVAIHAGEVVIGPGSRVTADGQGYAGGSRGAGKGPGGGGTRWGGGGHGGRGGDDGNGRPGAAYGSGIEPRDLGSSGAGDTRNSPSGTGKPGGGAIRLEVDGTLQLDGWITARGGTVNSYNWGGGGAGGSIWVKAGKLVGAGGCIADGGDGNNSGPGGGGRIAVYYGDASAYSGFGQSSARAGRDAIRPTIPVPAEVGTIAFFEMTAAGYALTVNGSRAQVPAGMDYSLARLIVAGGGRFELGQDSTLTIAGDLTVDEGGLFDLAGGGRLVVGDEIALTSGSRLLVHGKNADYKVGVYWRGEGGEIVAGRVSVDATSSISAKGQGYSGVNQGPGKGPGAGGPAAGGGGHGGAGLANSGDYGQPYGSELEPVELGSSGGSGNFYKDALSGAGGGAIRLEADELLLDGQLDADGQAGSAFSKACGAGGSLWVIVGSLAGSGRIHADGGDWVYNTGGAGGGGRVAVYAWNSISLPTESIGADGGAYSNNQKAGAGSIYVQQGPVFLWTTLESELFHDTKRIGWRARGATEDEVVGSLFANGAAGVFPLAVDLAPTGEFDWDTTNVADGRYELVLTFRDLSGATVGELRFHVLVNNSVSWHGGRLESSVAWGADRVHVVENSITIPNAVTLTIEEGAIVKFARFTGIGIEAGGALVALATGEAPIVLTALADDSVGGDTNLDKAQTIPIPGDWDGIAPDAGATLDLNELVDLRYLIRLWSGTLPEGGFWSGRMVHRVNGALIVLPNQTLTIEAGAIVKFESGKDSGIVLQSGAQLIAEGRFGEPVVFTSSRDDAYGGDTNGDGQDSSPSAGDWRWIRCENAQARLDRVIVAYGGGTLSGQWDGTAALIAADGGSILISNSTIRDAFFDGLLASGATAEATSCVFYGIDRAVCAHPGGVVRVVNCTIDDNRIGLLAHAGTLEAVNTVLSNCNQAGLLKDLAGDDPTVRYCDFWNPQASAGNISGVDIALNDNHNLTVDPKYKDAAGRDYRLDYLSPLIDAADGATAPSTDRTGAPRYDDPRIENTGTPTPSGACADLGAYEFVETADSPVDLIVVEVSGPTRVEAGGWATIDYELVNLGTEPAVGPWHDVLSLAEATTGSSRVIAVAERRADLVLDPGARASLSMRVRIPGTSLAPHRWRVQTNARGEVFEGHRQNNNIGESLAATRVEAPVLAYDQPTSVTASEQDDFWFWAYNPLAAKPLSLRVECSDSQARFEVYVKVGGAPTPSDFDQRGDPAATGVENLVLAQAQSGFYYVLVHMLDRPAQSTRFTLTLTPIEGLTLTGVQPRAVGRYGLATLTLQGSNFSPRTQAYLIDEAGTSRSATRLYYEDSATVYATFDMRAGQSNLFDVRVEDVQIHTQTDAAAKTIDMQFVHVADTLARAVTRQEQNAGRITVRAEAPPAVRAGRPFDLMVHYANHGNVDRPLPIVILSTADERTEFSGEDDAIATTGYYQFLGVSTSGPPESLRPGQQETYRVRVRAFGSDSIRLRYASTKSFDVDLADHLAARGIDPQTPDGQAVLERLRAELGGTNAAYQQSLGVPRDSLGRTHALEAILGDSLAVAALDGPAPQSPEAPEPSTYASKVPRWRQEPGAPLDNWIPPFGTKRYYGYNDPRNYSEDTMKIYRELLIANAGLFAGNPANIDPTSDLSSYMAGKHLAHFVEGDGSPIFYDLENPQSVDELYALKFKKDPKVNDFFNMGGPLRAPAVEYLHSIGSEMEPGEFRTVTGEIGVNADIGAEVAGIGLHWNSVDGQYGIGKVNRADGIMDLRTWVVEENGRRILYYEGTLDVTLDDVYQWDDSYDHGAWGTWNDPNFYGWYLQHYGYAKPFHMVIHLGKYKFSGSVVLSEGTPTTRYPTGIHPILPEMENAPPPIPVRPVGSVDPNEKYTVGSGEEGYVAGDRYLYFTVTFENMTTATAPAQEVLVTDALDANLDLTTLEFLGVSIGGRDFEFPTGGQGGSIETTVPVDAYPVRVEASLAPLTRTVRWLFQSVNPLTDALPEDPLAGFLPPNDETGRGEGVVRLRIKPLPGLPEGTQFHNKATITFDPTYGAAPPIQTRQVVNTLDLTPPTSAIHALPATVEEATVQVSWSGADAGGSGVATYDVYVSEEGGPYELWLEQSDRTEADFTGKSRRSYAFYSRARDAAGNLEDAPAAPDATVRLGGRNAAPLFLLSGNWTDGVYRLALSSALRPGAF